MKRFGTSLFTASVLLALILPSFAGDAEKPADAGEKKVEPAGKRIFLDSNCGLCHTVYSEGIGEAPVEKETEEKKASSKEIAEKDKGGPPDLSTFGARGTAEWLHAFLVEKKEIDGRKHMQRFKGEDADWAVLSEWLLGLGAPADSADAAPATTQAAPATTEAAPATTDAAAPAEGGK
ncbi:MAG: c-type cytochrome [Candidatus Eisenbacteria bacterium]